MPDTTQGGSPTAGADRYTVTARKYRPQTFDDLVAQEHVAETFRNAITRDRLAHVYLLCGPRGVGKTTAARLIAKAVNCETPLDQRDRAEPCRTCASCTAFEEGRSLNVFEIDAASNNGVDYMRDLRDKALVPPQGARKKVYILDEVHMLSASAFNALLKLLEEPPPFVMFIFATTEPHKVLPTILSRSQRFDFRRISVPEIVARLREISAAEGVTADEESLVLLARKGDGALRDALSVYDQAVSVCGDTLDIGALREALGVVDVDVFFGITDRARAGDRAGLLSLVDGVVRAGHDLDELAQGLADHLRNLLVARATGTGDLIEGTDATRRRYIDAAQPYGEADLLHLLMLTEQAAGDLRDSRQPRLTLELSLLKMASLESAADLRGLLDRLSALEGAVARGETPATAPERPLATAPAAQTAETPATYDAPSAGKPHSAAASQAAPPPEPAPAVPVPQPTRDPASSPVATAPAEASHGSAPAPPTPVVEPPVAEPLVVEPPVAEVSAARLGEGQTLLSPAAPAPVPQPPAGEPRGTDAREPEPPSDDEGGEPVLPPGPPPPAPPPPVAPAPAETASPAPAAASRASSLFGTPALRRTSSGDGHSASLDLIAPEPSDAASPMSADPLGPALTAVEDAWPQFVAAVREHVGVRVGAIVKAGAPFRVARGAVEIGMEDAFAVRVATDNERALHDVLAGLMPQPPPVRWVIAPKDTVETAAPSDPFEALKQMRRDHPVVRALFEQFGAEIVWQ